MDAEQRLAAVAAAIAGTHLERPGEWQLLACVPQGRPAEPSPRDERDRLAPLGRERGAAA